MSWNFYSMPDSVFDSMAERHYERMFDDYYGNNCDCDEYYDEDEENADDD